MPQSAPTARQARPGSPAAQPTPPTAPAPSVREATGDPAPLLAGEWLLTDGAGGFAMGSALGAPTRRYHALLTTATHAPVGRIVALNAIAEQLVLDPGAPQETRVDLSTFRFPGGLLHPEGWRALVRFEKDLSCKWTWRIDDAEVTKELLLLRAGGGCVVRYVVRAGARAARLALTPLVSLRDFHGNLRRHDGDSLWVDEGATGPGFADGRAVRVRRHDLTLDIVGDGARFGHAKDWWRRFVYDREAERGLDPEEDLFAPGRFVASIDARAEGQVTLHARLRRDGVPSAQPLDAPEAAQTAVDQRATRRRRLTRLVETVRGAGPALGALPELPALVQASDDFIAQRTVDGATSSTVIAGYPWFSDWGRDTLISLPGLMLATGRFDEARRTLETFARHTRRGLVPNVFDDASGDPHYNTVDAPLWFLHAACEYVRVTGDEGGFDARIKKACFQIVDAYRDGTDFGIHMDPADGLIAAGDATTQLTWMDAKRDNIAFTPRHGKAVEVNALWNHGLLALAEVVTRTDRPRATELRRLAEQAGKSFRRAFWNDADQCLFDCLYPDGAGGWSPSREIRPNQIFAVSLPHSPLTEKRQQAVVACVRQRLLTPFGLRTLAPGSTGYQPRFEGGMFERDRAYHNGTAWPWLMGPYVEALLRAGGFSAAARDEARDALRPLTRSLEADCLGQIAEVYDAEGAPERPQRAGGCPAQAWSVAEVLRAAILIESA